MAAFFSKAFLGLALLSTTFFFSASATASARIKVMSYNVENLFDLKHDEGKNDWAYLPKRVKEQDPRHAEACKEISHPRYRRECFQMDWSREVLRTKIAHISEVIKSSFNGRGPDILALQEIENIQALRELNDSGLQRLGYRSVALIEGPDERGIDTALLSRYPIVSQKSHTVKLPESDARPTRDILEVTLKVGSHKISVFVNHWPSQANPTSYREAAAKTLRKASLKAEQKGRLVIALGDFNSLFNEITGPVGEALQGSGTPLFIDAIEKRLSDYDHVETSLPGTHWHRGRWSFLDRAYILKSSVTSGKLSVDWPSLDAHDPDFALSQYEYRRRDGSREIGYAPKRFDANTKSGYSDHMPLVFEISLD